MDGICELVREVACGMCLSMMKSRMKKSVPILYLFVCLMGRDSRGMWMMEVSWPGGMLQNSSGTIDAGFPLSWKTWNFGEFKI